MLDEELVVYRDGEQYGLMAEHCAHRGTSLSYGFVEPGCRLRCPYHGWVYDSEGTVVEQPFEPVGSTFKSRVRQPAYPAQELAGGAQNALRESAKHVVAVGREEHDGFTAELLRRIEAPTLMLWTTHNPSTTAATAERATQYLPDGTFQLMKDCAHWPQWEKPEEFNAIVTEFLTGR